MDRETAVSIFNEYNSMEGYEPMVIPEDEQELIKQAERIGQGAHELFKGGNRENQVQTIIWLYDSAREGFPQEQQYVHKVDEPRKDLPRKSSGGFSDSDLREPDLVKSENLPEPQHIEGDPDVMPRDLTDCSDKEIRRLSGHYNAYLARTTYLLGLETSDLMNAEHLLEAERARTLRSLDLQDPNSSTKKQKLAKVIEAEILEDSRVEDLTNKVNIHQQRVVILKSLKEIYAGNVDRLSREWTMRQNEWEKSR